MKIFGGIGGAFLSIAYAGTKLTFVEGGGSADTIVDTYALFLEKGFMPGMSFTISDTVSNNKTVTIASVTAGTITLIATDDLTDEAEGTATLTSATKGAQVMGMNNITVNDGIDAEDTTSYEDYPFETHTLGFNKWTATIGGFWLTDVPKHHWIGKELTFMLFLRTATIPSAGDPAVYYLGSGLVTGLPTEMPTRQVVKQTISIQGHGQLTLTVKTTAW